MANVAIHHHYINVVLEMLFHTVKSNFGQLLVTLPHRYNKALCNQRVSSVQLVRQWLQMAPANRHEIRGKNHYTCFVFHNPSCCWQQRCTALLTAANSMARILASVPLHRQTRRLLRNSRVWFVSEQDC